MRRVLTMLPLAVLTASPALAQSPSGAELFQQQCGTCHTLHASEPQRQGPTLEHVYGRKIGSVPGYAYTAGYKAAGQDGKVWDDATLDEYLTSPQRMFKGSIMAYRQSKPAIRQAVIAYLKEQK